MIQLYINNQLVDITEEVGLFLNKKWEEVENPTLYFCDYSKTISLPFTSNNKKIFDNYSRQDSVVTDRTLDPRKKIPFQLLYNSQLVMEGYMKINNANTVYTDKKFECELFSQFGLIMNEIGELTFNKYETQSHGGEKPDKYLINSPWSDELKVDRNLIKDSFEQDTHLLDGEDILDYIKFIPTYQGKYPDFESDKIEGLNNNVSNLSRERDEHYTREFRSYYQQPAIFVNKLWQMTKKKVEEITDYEFNLDSSWFNSHNPYYTNLIYTCPSLFEKDDNFREIVDNFDPDGLNYHVNIKNQSNLSSHHYKKLFFSPNGELYNSGTFNQSRLGQTTITWNGRLQLVCPSQRNIYAKIRKDNPLYIRFYAVNAETNQPINQAIHTFMLYSCEYNSNISSSTFDDAYDVGIVDLNTVSSQHKPEGYRNTEGWWFSKDVAFTLNITQNVPYYIVCDSYFSNNGCGIETSTQSYTPHWDWLWKDKFYEGTGYHIFANMTGCSVKTSDYKRSHTKIDIYRIFPKDTTLLKVLLNYSKSFGLCWDVDQDNKKITVMSRNKFFSSYEIFDWSNKLDRKCDFVLEPLCFTNKYVCFNTEEGKGERLEKYVSKYDIGYGAKKLDTEYQFNSETENFFEGIQPSVVATKAQFSRLDNTTDPDAPDFRGYNYKVTPTEQYIDNDNDGENAGNFGAFYFWSGVMEPDERLGFISSEGYPCVLISDDTDYQVSHDEYFWNMSGTYFVRCYRLPKISTVSEDNWSVHFESPREYYFQKPAGEIKYIYDEFWKNFINERYSVQNKKLTAYFYLTPQDYKKITFRQFVKIENILYHVNRIFDYDFDTNSPTKVELVQVWNLDAYTGGQHSWQDLSVSPDVLEVYSTEWKSIEVFSSTDSWVIAEKPSWINYRIDEENPNRVWLKANSNPLRSRSGRIKVRSGNLEDVCIVTQKPSTPYMIINPTTAIVNGSGETITVSIESNPTEVSIVSKPSWCEVRIRNVENQPILPRTIIGSTNRINQVTTNIATISIRPNNSSTQRTGLIRFGNGNMTKDFTIRQLGYRTILYHFGDDIIHVESGSTGTWNLRCDKEIDSKSIKITRGSVSQANNNVIDNLQINFTPQLYSDDELTETSTGGVVSLKTLDGQTVTANYNFGPWLKNFSVTIRGVEGGSFTVDGVSYSTTYFESIQDETTITVSAIPNKGNTFVKWSDEVQTSERTITVNGSDIDIWPIFESDYYLYDNSNIVDFDNAEHIVYK